jgi:hypothetical protein
MHYVIFGGIFALPFVVCAGMLVARVLDTFAPDEPPKSGRIGKRGLHESDSRESDLADTFFNTPAEQTLSQ